MQELFIDNKKLIDEASWKKNLEGLNTPYSKLVKDKSSAINLLKKPLLDAVKNRLTKRFGIAFSGGVDSTLLAFLCQKQKADFTCYSVGLENSKDIEISRKVAEYYKFNFIYKILKLKEFESILKKTVKILKTDDVMKVSVGCVDTAVLELAKKDKVKTVFTGLGSEEIFAGYQRHEEALNKSQKQAHLECFNGLVNMWERDLIRDCSIGAKFKMDVRTPYLDKDLIKAAMSIHPSLKIDSKEKKIILREAAKVLGLKKEFAERPKKAAQYGSKFIKGIDKLAKKNGFKLKKDYLKSLK